MIIEKQITRGHFYYTVRHLIQCNNDMFVMTLCILFPAFGYKTLHFFNLDF